MAIETPEEHLENHPLTLELRRLGITDSQLAGMHFHPSNENFAFDQWSFRFPEDTPPSAIKYIKAYCALKWLVLENPPSSRERDDAWHLIGDVIAAPIFEAGTKYKEVQRKRAQKPRGKVEGSGQTLGQLIEALASDVEHLEYSTKELWPLLFSKLDDESLDPEEIGSSSTLEKSSYKYDSSSGRKSITFGRFANIISQYRAKKKSR